jgi:hypothetical protein
MTLTEAAEITKKSVYFVGIPIAAIFAIWMFLGIINPPAGLPEKYITPDYMCGSLEPFDMQALPQTTGAAKISIETTSGAIPQLPEVVNVFQYAHPGQSLLALEEAKIYAERLEFDPENYRRMSTTQYEWTNPETSQTLVIETGNLNMWMTTDFTDPDVNTYSDTLPSEEQAKSIARTYLQGKNLLTDDFQDGNQKTYLVQITADGQMREATSLAEADLIRVDFFRKKSLITVEPKYVGADELGPTVQEKLEEQEVETITVEGAKNKKVKKYMTDVINDNPIFGNITVYVGGLEDSSYNNYKVFELEYVNWIIADLPCGTYDLITPEEAVRKVQDGTATLVHLMEKSGDRIIPYEAKSVTKMTILEVDIAYLDKEARQEYLQPVFEIQGEAQFENGSLGIFYYYVPAINYDSIPEDAGQPQTEEPENPEEEN